MSQQILSTKPMLEAASLAALPGIRHGFFTRAGGVSEGLYASLNAGIGSRDEPARVAENRARMAQAIGVAADRFVTAYQIHSANVVVAEAPWTRAQAPRADAVVTRVRGLGVGISTADCGPVLLAEQQAGIVGAAHAGWKGALAGVVEATIAAMEQLGAARTRIIAALGPMIRQNNYEVGDYLLVRFVETEADNKRFFAPAARPGHAMFDLAGFIRARLERAGIKHVEDLGLCTYAAADMFYSFRRATHRAEADYGRHVNAIALID